MPRTSTPEYKFTIVRSYTADHKPADKIEFTGTEADAIKCADLLLAGGGTLCKSIEVKLLDQLTRYRKEQF